MHSLTSKVLKHLTCKHHWLQCACTSVWRAVLLASTVTSMYFICTWVLSIGWVYMQYITRFSVFIHLGWQGFCLFQSVNVESGLTPIAHQCFILIGALFICTSPSKLPEFCWFLGVCPDFSMSCGCYHRPEGRVMYKFQPTHGGRIIVSAIKRSAVLMSKLQYVPVQEMNLKLLLITCHSKSVGSCYGIQNTLWSR